MISRVTLGRVLLNNVSNFEISENIIEISNTAKITIPWHYKRLDDKPVLDMFHVGDKVKIEAGYYYGDDVDLETEFVGYISEIESDYPIVIHCEDESFILRQSNYNLSYRNATLKQVLSDIMPKGISFEAPDVNLGKYLVENKSAYSVLHDLAKDYALYSRLYGSKLKVGLVFDFGDKADEHTYTIGGNVKKSELKYKRERDFKIRVKYVSKNPNGTELSAEAGSRESDASERIIKLPGPIPKEELQRFADSLLKKIVYDGYTGSITGFGMPRTHAGDALNIKDKFEPGREGKYMIEKVDITYNENSGFSRQNTLSFKLE